MPSFLKNGGLKWAEKVRNLTPEMLANAARLSAGGGGIQAIAANKEAPQLVRDALSAMQMAFADVVGTDGHRRLCRHEGVAYMSLFGPPLMFVTPNLADTKQPLLLIVEGMELRLDDSELDAALLPRYRDMMQRLARDPVGQTYVFELIMRLFFVHVLGVRPECLNNRRRTRMTAPREWCTDGVAASSSAPGLLGPVLAFRGEIEAQGRGSLHPHILVWLLGMSSGVLVKFLQQQPQTFKTRVGIWMRAAVASVESTCHSSVQALPRSFGNLHERAPPLPLSKTERAICRFDGGSEVDMLVEEQSRGIPLSEAQMDFVQNGDHDSWQRPLLPLIDKHGQTLPPGQKETPRQSVYCKTLDEFAASRCPSYRRSHDLSSDEWEKLFATDVRHLATEILTHICGESCYKYSGSKVEHICRHGFYHIIALEDYKRRRRGKPLRNALFVVKQCKFGMQGRILQFQDFLFQFLFGEVAALCQIFSRNTPRTIHTFNILVRISTPAGELSISPVMPRFRMKYDR